VVVSQPITEEYQRVILEYGYRGDVVIHELNKLYAMNKYRESRADWENVPEDLAPTDDRHIVAPCMGGDANLVVTHDRGIQARKEKIRAATGADVLTLEQAQARLTSITPQSG
jgi:predicted nucleic acid-binding protein